MSRRYNFIAKSMSDGIAGGEKLKDRLHGDASAADNRAAVANIRFNGNTFRHTVIVAQN